MRFCREHRGPPAGISSLGSSMECENMPKSHAMWCTSVHADAWPDMMFQDTPVGDCFAIDSSNLMSGEVPRMPFARQAALFLSAPLTIDSPSR